jgi:hypothetical protein
MNKSTKTIIIVIAVIIVVFLLSLLIRVNKLNGAIGGETDQYGCLIAAGYSFNNSVGACIRPWELDESQRQAARIAVLPLSYRVTIVEVQTLRCPGCFVIKLQRNDNRNMFETKLYNWTFSWNCSDYPYSECPETCEVCPSCEYCSSVSCQSEESCTALGFNRTWYDGIKERLNGSNG